MIRSKESCLPSSSLRQTQEPFLLRVSLKEEPPRSQTSDGAPPKVEIILQANPDSVRRGCLNHLRNTTIRCTPRKRCCPKTGQYSLYERALTARLECLVGPPGTHPLPIVVDLVDYRRRCTRITRQRNWIAN